MIIGENAYLKKDESCFWGKISIPFFFFLFISMIGPTYLVWVGMCIYLIGKIICNNGHIIVQRIPGGICIVLIYFLGVLMGTLGLLFSNYEMWPFFRDCIRDSFLLLFWIVESNLLRKRVIDRGQFYRTIFFLAFSVSFIQLLSALPVLINIRNLSFSDIVDAGVIGRNELLMGMGVFLSFYRPKEYTYYFGKNADTIFKLIILLDFARSFSRTAMLIVFCLMLPNFVRRGKETAKILWVMLFLTLLISIVMPNAFGYFINKVARSFVEISPNSTVVWNRDSIVRNWRGFEIYLEKEHFKTISFLNKILGEGFGSSVYAGEYALLVTSGDSLPFFHNGYYTLLMKTGIIGVTLSIFYYLSNILLVLKKRIKLYDKNLYVGIMVSMMAATWFVGGIFIGGHVPLFVAIVVILPYLPETSIKSDSFKTEREHT